MGWLSSDQTAVHKYGLLTGEPSEGARGLAETDGPGDAIISTMSAGPNAVIDVMIFMITLVRWHEVRMSVLNIHSLGMCASNLSDSLRASISQS
jgi:hypothetical protein